MDQERPVRSMQGHPLFNQLSVDDQYFITSPAGRSSIDVVRGTAHAGVPGLTRHVRSKDELLELRREILKQFRDILVKYMLAPLKKIEKHSRKIKDSHQELSSLNGAYQTETNTRQRRKINQRRMKLEGQVEEEQRKQQSSIKDFRTNLNTMKEKVRSVFIRICVTDQALQRHCDRIGFLDIALEKGDIDTLFSLDKFCNVYEFFRSNNGVSSLFDGDALSKMWRVSCTCDNFGRIVMSGINMPDASRESGSSVFGATDLPSYESVTGNPPPYQRDPESYHHIADNPRHQRSTMESSFTQSPSGNHSYGREGRY